MSGVITDDIKVLKRQMAAVLIYMDNFEENFTKEPGSLIRMMATIKSTHEMIMKNYSKDEVEKYNPGLDFYVKQIAEKFDNMIEQKIVERDRTAEAIRELVNRKQIANYQR